MIRSASMLSEELRMQVTALGIMMRVCVIHTAECHYAELRILCNRHSMATKWNSMEPNGTQWNSLCSPAESRERETCTRIKRHYLIHCDSYIKIVGHVMKR